MRWLVVLLLLPLAAAEEWVAIETEDGTVLTNDGRTGFRDTAAGDGNLTALFWHMPALNWTPVHVQGDLVANVSFEVPITSLGEPTVRMALEAGGRRVAAGAPQALAADGDPRASWVVPVNGSWEAPLWWNVTVEGAIGAMTLRTDGPSRLGIPVAPAPAAPPIIETIDIEADVVDIQVSDPVVDEAHYTWYRAPGDVRLTWSSNLTGSVTVGIVDGNGTRIIDLDWPGPDGARNLTGALGDWVIHVTHADVKGTYALHLEAQPEVVAPRARSTPMPWFMVPLALALQSPRSR